MVTKRTVFLPIFLLLSACGADYEGPTVSGTHAELVQIQGTSCATLLAGQSIEVGTVCTSIEDETVRVDYQLIDGWELSEAHLWAGENLADLPQNRGGNPQIGRFPHHSGDITGAQTHGFDVPLATFGLSSDMTDCDAQKVYLAAHAAVRRLEATGGYQTETAWGQGTRLVSRGSWATWFSVLLTCTEEPPAPVLCESAYFAAGKAHCFGESDLVETDHWGWYNGPFGPGTYLYTIYAGADGCYPDPATKVGVLFFIYDGSTATVTYEMLPGFTMNETHLYIGNEPLPVDDAGEYTIALGLFPFSHLLDGATLDTYEISGLSGEVYVIAHAVTCADE